MRQMCRNTHMHKHTMSSCEKYFFWRKKVWSKLNENERKDIFFMFVCFAFIQQKKEQKIKVKNKRHLHTPVFEYVQKYKCECVPQRETSRQASQEKEKERIMHPKIPSWGMTGMLLSILPLTQSLTLSVFQSLGFARVRVREKERKRTLGWCCRRWKFQVE